MVFPLAPAFPIVLYRRWGNLARITAGHPLLDSPDLMAPLKVFQESALLNLRLEDPHTLMGPQIFHHRQASQLLLFHAYKEDHPLQNIVSLRFT